MDVAKFKLNIRSTLENPDVKVYQFTHGRALKPYGDSGNGLGEKYLNHWGSVNRGGGGGGRRRGVVHAIIVFNIGWIAQK
jgi:hypothetical protein